MYDSENLNQGKKNLCKKTSVLYIKLFSVFTPFNTIKWA